MIVFLMTNQEAYSFARKQVGSRKLAIKERKRKPKGVSAAKVSVEDRDEEKMQKRTRGIGERRGRIRRDDEGKEEVMMMMMMEKRCTSCDLDVNFLDSTFRALQRGNV